MSADDVAPALPFLVLLGGAFLVLILARWLRADGRSWMLLAAVVASGSGAGAALLGGGQEGFGGLLRRDGASAFLGLLVAACTTAAALLEASDRAHDARRGARAAALMLLCASGASLMASAGDLVVALAGVALLSVPLHLLATPRHEQTGSGRGPTLRRSAIAPVLFAIGSALIFADTGSTRIGTLAGAATVGQAGIALILAALAQTIALVPFHVVAPEFDTRAPAPILGFVALAGKLGGFAMLLRVAGAVTASGNAEPDWRASLAVLAALSMTVGSLVALVRSSLRQVLVFLAVAQAGSIAIGFASGGAAGPASAFALAALLTLVIGASAAIFAVGGRDPALVDLQGLARRRPLLAVALGVLMLGLAGLPPTVGFLAKVYLFEAATGAQLAWLVIVGALTMVVSAACAFRVVFACFGEGPVRPSEGRRVSTGIAIVAATAVLLVGLAPGPLRDAVQGVRF